MRQAEIDILQDRIQNELGIDISKYRDDEVAENFMDLLLFPKYLLKWVSRPIILSLLLFIIGFFVIDLVHIEYVIYAIVGLFLFFTLGLFLGVLYFAKQLGEDIGTVAQYSLNIMKNSLQDVGNFGGKVKKGNARELLSVLFQGIIFIVTIPMLRKAIDKKVPAGKGIVKRVVIGALSALAARITFKDQLVNESDDVSEDEENNAERYVAAVSKSEEVVSGLVEGVVKIGSSPFRLGAYILGFFLLLFLYFIW